MKSSKSIKNKFTDAIVEFSKLGLIFIFIIALSRIYEITSFGLEHGFIASNINSQLMGLFFDITFSFQVLFVLFVLFVLLYLLNKTIAKVMYIVIASLIILSNLSLISYFKLSMIPLGNDLFAYSIDEITHTINASGGSNFMTYLSFVFIVGLFIFLSIMLSKVLLRKGVSYIFILLSLISILLASRITPNISNFKKDFNYYLAVNKTQFFFSNLYHHTNKNKDIPTDITKIDIITTNNWNDFEYVSKEYPLLHVEKTPDVLGAFFNQSQTPPNIVFIIVESLGRAYCGENAYLGSFTPYLDSLMKQSLYWENFLSTGGRTFAVLPSLFGSLPFGEKGFLEMNDKMPAHQSLLKILKKNGYYTRFYYGGDAHFDLMDVFLKKQNIDAIYDNAKFGNGYKKLPSSSNGFSWGYGDKEIFKKSFDILKKDNNNPKIDIFLTIAMHSPFLIPEQKSYNDKFEKRMVDIGLKEQDKTERRSYHDKFECILYFDDALKYFMEEYSKRDDYENTIFVITGDHRMPEIPISTQIDRFHVPLVIYSPLLKKGQKFSAISTQFDVTPTILSYLNHNYDIKIPKYTAWLGHGLDTEVSFNKKCSYPLMRNKNELVDYIDGDYFLSNDAVYDIFDNMYIEKAIDNNQQESINAKFQNFITINNYVCKNNKILPDSLR